MYLFYFFFEIIFFLLQFDIHLCFLYIVYTIYSHLCTIDTHRFKKTFNTTPSPSAPSSSTTTCFLYIYVMWVLLFNIYLIIEKQKNNTQNSLSICCATANRLNYVSIVLFDRNNRKEYIYNRFWSNRFFVFCNGRMGGVVRIVFNVDHKVTRSSIIR